MGGRRRLRPDLGPEQRQGLRRQGRLSGGRADSPVPRTLGLLTFVLVSFAANSLVTRYVVANHLLDAYLLTVVRFVAGAVMLLAVGLARRERPRLGRANLRPALWLGVYAVCISFGYQHIGAAAGTFVFYATVLAGLVGYDLATRNPVPRNRAV